MEFNLTNVRVKIAEARGVYYELGDALDTLKKQEPDASKHAEEFLALAQRLLEHATDLKQMVKRTPNGIGLRKR